MTFFFLRPWYDETKVKDDVDNDDDEDMKKWQEGETKNLYYLLHYVFKFKLTFLLFFKREWGWKWYGILGAIWEGSGTRQTNMSLRWRRKWREVKWFLLRFSFRTNFNLISFPSMCPLSCSTPIQSNIPNLFTAEQDICAFPKWWLWPFCLVSLFYMCMYVQLYICEML